MTKWISSLKGLVVICVSIVSALAVAAPHQSAMKVVPKNILVGEGALQGGVSGTLTSLLDIRSTTSKNQKLERLVLDIGDQNQKKLQGKLGYYTVEMKANNQVAIHLSQTITSKLKDRDLQTKLIKSGFVKSSRLMFDPVGQVMTLVLDLKRPAAVKVLAVSGAKETGKLVVDFQEKGRL